MEYILSVFTVYFASLLLYCVQLSADLEHLDVAMVNVFLLSTSVMGHVTALTAVMRQAVVS